MRITMGGGMTKITQLKNSIVILLLLTTFSCHATRSEKMNSINFWKFVNNVKVQTPEGLFKLAPIFNNAFVVQAENDVFISYSNSGLMLDGKVNIENIEARVFRKNRENIPFLLSLQISGICITKAELKLHYSDLTLTDTPRGRSLEEETSYSTRRNDNGVRLSFGFAEKSPDCLRSVVFSVENTK